MFYIFRGPTTESIEKDIGFSTSTFRSLLQLPQIFAKPWLYSAQIQVWKTFFFALSNLTKQFFNLINKHLFYDNQFEKFTRIDDIVSFTYMKVLFLPYFYFIRTKQTNLWNSHGGGEESVLLWGAWQVVCNVGLEPEVCHPGPGLTYTFFFLLTMMKSIVEELSRHSEFDFVHFFGTSATKYQEIDGWI